LKEIILKHNFDISNLTYFLPHMSSEFFRSKIKNSLSARGITIVNEKWFTNLESVGNVGAASGFLMLEEIYNSGKLKPSDTILLMIPESASFSYTFVHFTVV
jgi:3-oxoacyl-[acyl-carrier-protein] synthase III